MLFRSGDPWRTHADPSWIGAPAMPANRQGWQLAARAGLFKYSVAETPWFLWVARQLAFRDGDRVIDIGCGPAWFWAGATGALPAKLDLTLTDLSPGMVQEALERCRTLPFGSVHGRQADAVAVPFGDGVYDAAIAMHMLYHVADPARALSEMHRLVRPGGFVAVTTNGAGNMREIYELATVFGSPPIDPSAAALGFEKTERLMRSVFDDVTVRQHPARLRITDPDDVFLAMTSYPPGENASDAQKAALRHAIGSLLPGREELAAPPEPAGVVIHRLDTMADGFTVELEDDGAFRVRGPRIERIAAQTNFEVEESAERFQRDLARLGVDAELRRRGVAPGDVVRIGATELAWEIGRAHV